MFTTKTLLVGALAALAAAQSSVLTFTNVPDPITDGQPQAITFATNDTSSVSGTFMDAFHDLRH